MTCTGDGKCIQECRCVARYVEDQELCKCGHLGIDHFTGTRYCKVTTCQYDCDMVPCHNFRECGHNRPEWELNENRGMCKDCAHDLGKLTFPKVDEECPICYEVEEVVILPCGKHKICRECWVTWCESIPSDKPPCCPMCREPIW